MRCGTSRVNHRPSRSESYALDLFREYLTHYDSKVYSAERRHISSRSTAYRRMADFLSYTPPPLPLAPRQAASHTTIMVDGFYIAYPSIRVHRHLPGAKTDESVLLLAIDAMTFQPLHWVIYRRLEDVTTWLLFFNELAKLGFSPQLLIHDGHYGIPIATSKYFPEITHQRCLVHMVRNVHKDIGITPKAPLAKQLQSLIYQLVKVQTSEDRVAWEIELHTYLEAFSVAESAGAPRTKAFLSLRTVLTNAYKRGELFAFLAHPGLPNNTNAIESQNKILRESLGRHRGMTLKQREAFVAWRLLFKSTDDLAVIRAHYKGKKD